MAAATLGTYFDAFELFEKEKMPHGALQLYTWLSWWVPSSGVGHFTTKHIADKTRQRPGTIRKYFSILCRLGLVASRIVNQRKGEREIRINKNRKSKKKRQATKGHKRQASGTTHQSSCPDPAPSPPPVSPSIDNHQTQTDQAKRRYAPIHPAPSSLAVPSVAPVVESAVPSVQSGSPSTPSPVLSSSPVVSPASVLPLAASVVASPPVSLPQTTFPPASSSFFEEPPSLPAGKKRPKNDALSPLGDAFAAMKQKVLAKVEARKRAASSQPSPSPVPVVAAEPSDSQPIDCVLKHEGVSEIETICPQLQMVQEQKKRRT